MARRVRGPAGAPPPALASTTVPANATASGGTELVRRWFEDETLDRNPQDAARELPDSLLEERPRAQQVRQLQHRYTRPRQVAGLERRGQPVERLERRIRGLPEELPDTQRRGRGGAAVDRRRDRAPAGAEQHDEIVRAQAREPEERRVDGGVAGLAAERFAVAQEGELQIGPAGRTRRRGAEELQPGFEITARGGDLGIDGDEVGPRGRERKRPGERGPRLFQTSLAERRDRQVGVWQRVVRNPPRELGEGRSGGRRLLVLELGEAFLAQAQGRFVERCRRDGRQDERDGEGKEGQARV